MAQGEYVAPEKLENIYAKSEYIAQIYVHGDSLRAELVAVVVPEMEKLGPWLKKRGLDARVADACKRDDVRELLIREIQRMAKLSKLAG